MRRSWGSGANVLFFRRINSSNLEKMVSHVSKAKGSQKVQFNFNTPIKQDKFQFRRALRVHTVKNISNGFLFRDIDPGEQGAIVSFCPIF